MKASHDPKDPRVLSRWTSSRREKPSLQAVMMRNRNLDSRTINAELAFIPIVSIPMIEMCKTRKNKSYLMGLGRAQHQAFSLRTPQKRFLSLS